jgi:hypothetical protein
MILVRIDHPYLRVEHHRGEVIEEPVLGGCAERGGGNNAVSSESDGGE